MGNASRRTLSEALTASGDGLQAARYSLVFAGTGWDRFESENWECALLLQCGRGVGQELGDLVRRMGAHPIDPHVGEGFHAE